MPRRNIQRAFLSWLEENRGRLALDITLGKRTDTLREFSFAGINPAISGALTTYEIMVFAIRDSHTWDILLDVEAEPKRVPGGGYVCDLCRPDARTVFADRATLWADHLFEGLLVWVNDNLAQAKWLALYGSPEQASWARLLPSDDPSRTLRGGGLTLSFAWISGETSRGPLDERPTILLPCRTP
jgi:hypothetical protein